ncbi:hypothetical protein KM043_011451 [Ampulex compressa]|nr:hypothetical protein KM043_011451 [Ampulex compressa]
MSFGPGPRRFLIRAVCKLISNEESTVFQRLSKLPNHTDFSRLESGRFSTQNRSALKGIKWTNPGLLKLGSQTLDLHSRRGATRLSWVAYRLVAIT